jgi:hypothetical protein
VPLVPEEGVPATHAVAHRRAYRFRHGGQVETMSSASQASPGTAAPAAEVGDEGVVMVAGGKVHGRRVDVRLERLVGEPSGGSVKARPLGPGWAQARRALGRWPSGRAAGRAAAPPSSFRSVCGSVTSLVGSSGGRGSRGMHGSRPTLRPDVPMRRDDAVPYEGPRRPDAAVHGDGHHISVSLARLHRLLGCFCSAVLWVARMRCKAGAAG